MGLCDVAESCDGETTGCPVDDFAGAERECRRKNDSLVCDTPEVCNDRGPDCPADVGATGTPRVDPPCRTAASTAPLCDADAVLQRHSGMPGQSAGTR